MVKLLNIFFFYLVGDVLLVILSLYLGGFWLLNTQVAFIASMLIVYSSFFGYKKFVTKQVPFEETSEDKESGKFADKSKKIIATFKGAFSPFRMLSYFLLVVAFLSLNRHGAFLPFAFLAGLGVVPLATLFWSFIVQKTN